MVLLIILCVCGYVEGLLGIWFSGRGSVALGESQDITLTVLALSIM